MEKTLKKYFPLFVLPTLAAFIIGFIVPFAEGIYLSFCKFTTVGNASWVGVSNYVKAFSDATFRSAFWFTLGFTAVSTILINVLAFAIALLLTRGIKGTNVFRTVFFMPNLIGGIVLGYIWQILINCVLSLVKQPLLQLNTAAGYWGLIILMCWQQVGYMMIIYIAGLQNVPGDLIEAAQIDGCNPIQTYFRIVFPIFKPTMISVAILEAMWVWNDYLLPTLVLDIKKYRTIPMLIQYFRGSYGRVEMGPMMACIMLTVLPIIILYLACQKYIIEGVVAGAVKG